MSCKWTGGSSSTWPQEGVPFVVVVAVVVVVACLGATIQRPIMETQATTT